MKTRSKKRWKEAGNGETPLKEPSGERLFASCYVISIFLLALISTTLSCLLGWLVSLITRRLPYMLNVGLGLVYSLGMTVTLVSIALLVCLDAGLFAFLHSPAAQRRWDMIGQ